MTDHAPEEKLRWYGRRRGHKLRPGRQALVDTLLPRLRLEPPAEGGVLDLAAAFPNPVRDVWFEIGFGAGEHLGAQAKALPEIGFIGCEPFINGVAGLLSLIERDGLANVRIFDDDARRLLNFFPDAGVGRVFVLFSDPWPKKRHHRRRLISDGTLDDLARLLKDGGELRFASDHMGYVRWTLERVIRHPDFHWPVRSCRDWAEPPSDWVQTRYEEKARTKGLSPVYLRFLRRPRGPDGNGEIAENH